MIPSRDAGTDDAILAAISTHSPRRLLDVGCGEGWLCRQSVQTLGCEATGIDGSSQLIADAQCADPNGRYEVITYQELMDGGVSFEAPFDVIVFNYALFDEDAPSLLAAIRPHLSAMGVVIIQTLHPWSLEQGQDYRDGWRNEDFSAFENQNWTAMPWYFRTLSSWHQVVRTAGLALLKLEEPMASFNGQPLSLLLTCECHEGDPD